LWAIGRVVIGLSSDEFWELTPREFRALARRAAGQPVSERRGALEAIRALRAAGVLVRR
jgi:uncharacterized phage protein (TIGR02216 family)